MGFSCETLGGLVDSQADLAALSFFFFFFFWKPELSCRYDLCIFKGF